MWRSEGDRAAMKRLHGLLLRLKKVATPMAKTEQHVLEDIPMLRAAIDQALHEDDANCYRLCNLVEALSHLPDVGSVPELLEVFFRFRYSYGRALAAKALHVTAPDHFREKLAMECLRDCEARTRIHGEKAASLETHDATGRLRHLASDPWEDEEVRAEARKRMDEC